MFAAWRRLSEFYRTRAPPRLRHSAFADHALTEDSHCFSWEGMMNLRFNILLFPLYFRLSPFLASLAHHRDARLFCDPRDLSRSRARPTFDPLTLSPLSRAPLPRLLIATPLVPHSNDLPSRLPLSTLVLVRLDRIVTSPVSDPFRIFFRLHMRI